MYVTLTSNLLESYKALKLIIVETYFGLMGPLGNCCIFEKLAFTNSSSIVTVAISCIVSKIDKMGISMGKRLRLVSRSVFYYRPRCLARHVVSIDSLAYS